MYDYLFVQRPWECRWWVWEMAASSPRTGSGAWTRARPADFGNSFSEWGKLVLFDMSASPVVLMGVAGGGIVSFEVLRFVLYIIMIMVTIFTVILWDLFFVVFCVCFSLLLKISICLHFRGAYGNSGSWKCCKLSWVPAPICQNKLIIIMWPFQACTEFFPLLGLPFHIFISTYNLPLLFNNAATII